MTAPVCKDCAAPVSKLSTGRCRSCANRIMWADPAFQERRLAALRIALRTPEAIANKRAARLKLEAERSVDAAWKEYKRQSGKRLRASYDAHPDAHARNMAKRKQAGAKVRATRLAWCPADRWDEYQRMRKKVGAAEARRAIEEEIVGTEAHARLQVARNLVKDRLKHEREQAQAY